MAPNYKLVYFNARGLIEPARFIFAYAGVKYEDVRINMDEKWKELKKETPFGMLPYLEIDGKRISQSTVICRFLAQQFKLTGKDAFESIQCDEIVATIMDVVNEVRGLFQNTPKVNEIRMKIISTQSQQIFDDNYNDMINEEARDKFLKETLPFYYEKFDNIVKKNDGYIVENSLTWADFVLVHQIANLTRFAKTDLLNSFPNLQALTEKVNSLPAISDWIKKRPQTVF